MADVLGTLNPGTRWLGQTLECHAELDSTNLRAQELARAGAPDGTVVLADGQSAGRGRLGRSFFSPPGVSLYLSALLRPKLPPERLHEHVFAASLAVAELAAQHVDPARIAIKWPNDVQIDGRKLSGINAPAQLREGAVEFLVLGIGLNVNPLPGDFPAELQPTATSLRIACGRALERGALAEELLRQLENQLDRVRGQQFASVLKHWRLYFKMRGQRVRIGGIGTGGPGIARERDGIAEDIAPDGALVLRVGHGASARRERVLAGDVSLLEPASEAD